MKTLKQLSNESVGTYRPKPEGEQRFVDKHLGAGQKPVMAPGFEGETDRAGNSLSHYRGVTTSGRSDKQGYAAAPSDEDEKVYEGKTWRAGDNEKHKRGAAVKKFLNKKRKSDEKRLQESIDIPEGEGVVVLVEDVNEAADAADVRALKGTVALKQFVGIVGTSPDQHHYVVQDQAGRRHHIFTNKALGDKGDKVDLHVKEYKKGAGLLSVAKKNMVKEDLNEGTRPSRDPGRPAGDSGAPATAHQTYMHHVIAIKHLLGHISSHVDDHVRGVNKPHEVAVHDSKGSRFVSKDGQANWAHVGSMKHYRNQLEDIRDSLTQQGEYANPTYLSGRAVKEEIAEKIEQTPSQKFIEGVGQEIASLVIDAHEQGDDEVKQMIDSLISEERWEDIIEIFSSVEEVQE